MAQAARSPHGPRSFRSLRSVLNADGEPHPVENTFAAATLLLGAVAAITAIFSGLHVISSWTGLLGLLGGGYGQMISATTAERFLLIIGLGAAGLGCYLGLAHGGFFPGMFD